MKKIIMTLLLLSSQAFPMVDNLHRTTELIKESRVTSDQIFNCHYTFNECNKELITTINLLSSEIDILLNKYNDTKELKYIALCCILRDMRTLGTKICNALSDYHKYGFTRFTWRLNRACDKKLALKIKKDLHKLVKRVNSQEKIVLEQLICHVDAIILPGKIRLLNMMRYMWSRR